MHVADPNFSWMVGFKEFAHPATQTFSAVGQAGPTFFLAIAMFGFVFQISSLVTEKELKLRQVLIIHSSKFLVVKCMDSSCTSPGFGFNPLAFHISTSLAHIPQLNPGR